MRIIQLLSHLNIGDAIGNDVLAIDEALKRAGYESVIMALTIHEALRDRAEPADLTKVKKEDVLLFHKANGDPFTAAVAGLDCVRVMIYHNLTPASFFWPYDPVMALNQVRGRRQLKAVLQHVDEVWAPSTFNCEEIRRCGFPEERTHVLPILMDVEERDNTPAGRTKILFVGRVAPNKKQEDLIKAYFCYLKYDPEAQLVLMGSWSGFEKYYAKLKGFAADLGLSDEQVFFPGHISDQEKERYLTEASLYLCMSEHEGFCIPVLEAMAHGIPVMAYRSCAVPETVGENGLLFDRKDYEAVAKEMDRLIRDPEARRAVLEKQRENLRRFDRAETERKLLSLLEGVRNRRKA